MHFANNTSVRCRGSLKRYEYAQTFDLLDRMIVGLRFEKRPMSCAISEGRGECLGGDFSLLEIANRVGPTWLTSEQDDEALGRLEGDEEVSRRETPKGAYPELNAMKMHQGEQHPGCESGRMRRQIHSRVVGLTMTDNAE